VTRAAGLAALIVNYNSGAFAVSCTRSLQHEWARSGRPREQLHVVVVDNRSPVDQEAHLTRLEELGATVLRHGENAGYAKGMNLAYARTRGGPRDFVAILNPDLFFLPGSIDVLLAYLEQNPRCGAVDPRACMDPLGVLLLPRNLLPTLSDHARVVLAHMSPALCRAYSRHRHRQTLPWWTAEGPLETDMLSGCCVFLRREVVERMGRVMDERYPLYYEDTDLFRTLRGLGLSVVHHGSARVLHHWSRSAGVGGEFANEPMRRYAISQREYFRKWYGPGGAWLVAAINRLQSWWPASWTYRPMHELVTLGPFDEPATIPLPRRCRFVIEITMAPTFLVCAGILGEGERFTFPQETWDWLFQAEFFLRALDRDTGELLGAWRFVKTTPGRDAPIDVAEIEAWRRDGKLVSALSGGAA
jgi:GT2 family glycosyltransferase